MPEQATFWFLVANLPALVFSLVMAMRPLLPWKLIVSALAVFLAAICSPLLFLPRPISLCEAALYVSPPLYIAGALWDSRTFLLEAFTFRTFLLYRPHYVSVTAALILIFVQNPQTLLSVDVPVAALGVAVGVLVPELTYSFCKRRKLVTHPMTAAHTALPTPRAPLIH